MRFAKLMGAAGLLVTSAVIGGTLIGSVLAAPSTGTGPTTLDANGLLGGDGEYCDVFLDTLSSELGVSRADLLPAGRAAAVAAVDAALAAGDIDEERATALKERIEGIEEAGCGLFGAFGKGFAAGHARGFLHADVLDAAAGALNLDSSDLIEQMADGSSLQDVAEAQGVRYDDVKAAVVAAVQADLDAAVAEGLDQDRADAALERIQAWLDEVGEPGKGRLGRGPGRGGPGWH